MSLAITGWLMSENHPMAEIKDGELTILDEKLLPYHFTMAKLSLDEWLRSRAIDGKRKNSRLLKRALKLSDESAEQLVMSVNAAMITDTYWIKETDSDLTYEDIRFKENQFADIALLGSFSDYGKPTSRTPELTNTGSFEKCWRLEDGVWWLYKVGDSENLFSELAAYKLAEHFGYDTAHYELIDPAEKDFIGKLKGGKGIIRTRDFTRNASVNFEAAAGLGMKTDDIGYNYKRFEQMNPALAEQYLDIVTLDALIYNLDRHLQNFGVLRDVQTGEILSLAPNYDNNLSLLCGIHGMKERSLQSDELLREWKQLMQGNLIPIELPIITDEELHEILNGMDCGISKDDKQIAFDFIRQGYEIMSEVSEQLHRFNQGQGMIME